ncbi:hypothetical protein H4R34_004994 [Dimargaris verticillata]|uniref:Uncharacterized protein n=1 Tax=Dimargaris verticillata TaxID=2761393 RepID=A0A9W8EBN7_9FUNG|nr:hypothetical protein H4R34_004994 [Dimargaris verticillata]
MTHPIPSTLHHRHPHTCSEPLSQTSSAPVCAHAAPSSGPDTQENLVATAYAYWLAFHAQSLAIVAVQRAVRTHQLLGGPPPSVQLSPNDWPSFPVTGPRPVFKHLSEPDHEIVAAPRASGTPMAAAKSVGLYPFGWRRLPVILTLAQLLYLFFVAAHTITESIEHLASSGSHDTNTETRFWEGSGLALPM